LTTDQALAFGLLGATIACFVWGKLRYDLIALAALVAGALLGLIPADRMFSGFSNDLIWIIASALLLSTAIARSGLIEKVLGSALSKLVDVRVQTPAFAGAVMLLSMMTKNIGALAIVMPVAMQQARRTGVQPSRLLMPMAFASLLGGLVTLVGTSPNVIVSSVRESLLGEPFQMFDFAPVGLGVCLAGFIFLAIAPHFIQIDRTPAPGLDAALADTRYVTEMSLGEKATAVGMTIAELEETAKGDVRIIAILLDKKRKFPTPDLVLESGAHIVVEGDEEALEKFAAASKLSLVGERHRDETETPAKISVLEGVIREGSSLVGLTPAEARLHDRYGLSLLAIHRSGRQVRESLSATRLRAGDVVLFKVDEEQAGEALAELHILPLSERAVTLGHKRFGAAPLVALGCAVLAVTFQLVPIALAFTAAAVAVLLLRVMSMTDAYRSIEGPMLVLLAALIPISQSIEATGGDKLIADLLSNALGPMPPYLAIATLIATAMAVTPFLNNAATVLIVAPIAAATAQAIDVNPDAFLMAVAIGAACDFLTPIGHQCNTLVMGPGGYQFSDYWKLGLPLSLLVIVVATPLIAWTWPLQAAP
jgi:di/tricarboxylate transporter